MRGAAQGRAEGNSHLLQNAATPRCHICLPAEQRARQCTRMRRAAAGIRGALHPSGSGSRTSRFLQRFLLLRVTHKNKGAKSEASSCEQGERQRFIIVRGSCAHRPAGIRRLYNTNDQRLGSSGGKEGKQTYTFTINCSVVQSKTPCRS